MNNKLQPVIFSVDDEQDEIRDFVASTEKERIGLFFESGNLIYHAPENKKTSLSIINIFDTKQNFKNNLKSTIEERLDFLIIKKPKLNLNDTFYLGFIKMLNKHNVEYLLIGGLAVAYHGYPRTTHDMDLWSNPEPDNAKKLLKAIDEYGYDISSLEGVYLKNNEAIKLPYNQQSHLRKIDILANVSGLYDFKQSYQNRVVATLDDVKMNFINYRDLIAAKIATHRPKDINDIQQLEKISAEIKRQKKKKRNRFGL
jgi:predicted nucleotidyltransferase